MRRVIHLAVLGLAAACGGGGADEGPPPVQVISTDANAQDEMAKFSPDGSQIAFYRPGDKGWQLWVANADMSEARGLDAWAPGDVPLIWSPDGSQIALGANMRSISDIAVVSLASGAVTFLTDAEALELPIQFSPDGAQVVYVALSGGNKVETGIAMVDGSGAGPVISGMAESHIGYLSPDGSRFGYTVFEAGSRQTIWVADANGANPRQLTTEGFEALPFGRGAPWSPDGTELLYFSTRTGRNDIWAVRVADGTTRQITSDIRDDVEAAWSPDGRTIAFISTRGRQRDVWLVPAVGGDPTRVTDDATEEEHLGWRADGSLYFSAGGSPGSLWQRSLTDGSEFRLTPDSVDPGGFHFSPDRSQIAFAIDLPSGDRDVAVMPAVGGAHRVISTGGNNLRFRWNPAGTEIAFESNRSGNSDVWVVPADGSTPARQVTDWPSFESLQDWTADGAALIVTSNRESALADVYRVPVAGGEVVRLTTRGGVGGVSLSWAAPDGEMYLDALGERGEFVILKRAVDGSLEQFVAGPPGADISLPLWAVDGSRFAVTWVKGGETGVEVISAADGTVLTSVGDDLGRVNGRAFSPDGTKLLTGILVNGNMEVGILDIASGVHTRVTETPENETIARFTADGQSIIMRRVFVSQRVMVADVSALVGSPGE